MGISCTWVTPNSRIWERPVLIPFEDLVFSSAKPRYFPLWAIPLSGCTDISRMFASYIIASV